MQWDFSWQHRGRTQVFFKVWLSNDLSRGWGDWASFCDWVKNLGLGKQYLWEVESMGIARVNSDQYRQLFHPPCELHRVACEPEPDRQFSFVRSALEVHCDVLFLFWVNSSSRTLVISSFELASRETEGYSDQLQTPCWWWATHKRRKGWILVLPQEHTPQQKQTNNKQQQNKQTKNQKVLTG